MSFQILSSSRMAFIKLIPNRSIVISRLASSTSQFLKIPESVGNGPAREIAYNTVDGSSKPGVVYIPGFHAHSKGVKPKMINKLCQELDIPFISYDPTGLGETKSQLNMSQIGMSHWIRDAQQVITRLTHGKQIIVGSSMGCWISCILAQRLPEHFGAMLLLSPAMNFGHHYMVKFKEMLPPNLLKKFLDGEVVSIPSEDYGSIVVSMHLLEDMIRNEAPQDAGSLKVDCPVRIIFSMKDADVPFPSVMRLLASFSGEDVQLRLLRGGSHQLHEEDSIAMIKASLLRLRQHKDFGGSGEELHSGTTA